MKGDETRLDFLYFVIQGYEGDTKCDYIAGRVVPSESYIERIGSKEGRDDHEQKVHCLPVDIDVAKGGVLD